MFIALFSAGVDQCCAFNQPRKVYGYAEPKPFCWAKPVCFDFTLSNFSVKDQILSTAGDPLRAMGLQAF
jgi:hypothetical protein